MGFCTFLWVQLCKTAKQQLCKSSDQTQLVQLPEVLFSRGHEVNPGGLDAAVPQHIRQPHHVVAGAIEGPGEQTAEIVGEYFRPLHARRFAEGFHTGPDRLPGNRETVLGEK